MDSLFPVRCFSCGMVISDKYRAYLAAVANSKIAQKDFDHDHSRLESVQYLTKEFRQKTHEGNALDSLGIMKPCCRRHFLLHPH